MSAFTLRECPVFEHNILRIRVIREIRGYSFPFSGLSVRYRNASAVKRLER
jgi:hypothetical protein